MELRQIALEVARILQDAGKHALNDQTNPHDMRRLEVSEDCFHFTSNTDERLQQFISNRLTYVDVFDGFWQLRPEQCYPGQRYWCVGGIDGVINFARNMPEHHRDIIRIQRTVLRTADPFDRARSGAGIDVSCGAWIRCDPYS